jgi:hypothetical protein
MPNDRVIAQNGMPRLLQIVNANNDQGGQQQNPSQTCLAYHQLQ